MNYKKHNGYEDFKDLIEHVLGGTSDDPVQVVTDSVELIANESYNYLKKYAQGSAYSFKGTCEIVVRNNDFEALAETVMADIEEECNIFFCDECGWWYGEASLDYNESGDPMCSACLEMED